MTDVITRAMSTKERYTEHGEKAKQGHWRTMTTYKPGREDLGKTEAVTCSA